jgi:hypothetical protein
MKKIVITVLSVFLIFSSCSNIDFGDINNNPNGAKVASPSSLMAGAFMRYGTLTGRTYMTVPTLYAQYTAQRVYTDEMQYNTEPRSWYGYYVQTLSSLQKVIEINEAAGDTPDGILLAQGSPKNQIAVSLIMQSIIFKRLTDTYGDIPYSDAFNLVSLVPTYDSQENVYKGLIETVKKARDMMDDGNGPTGDPIYGGDIAKWKKFANSFLMSCAMQISKVYPANGAFAATEFNAALTNEAGVIETNDDEAFFSFDVKNGFVNPWDAMRPADYGLSKEFTDALRGITGDGSLNPTSNKTLDARINVFSDKPEVDGQPYGYEGDGVAIASHIWDANAKYPIMTAAYTYLNRAEAANLGWTSESAADMLTAGITASYGSFSANFGVDIDANAADYAAARVADMATASAAQVIGEEKWVALFPAGFDAWAEQRRTGYPNLKPSGIVLNDGNIPTRYIYPSEESSLNGDAYKTGVSGLVPAEDINTSKVWWDK